MNQPADEHVGSESVHSKSFGLADLRFTLFISAASIALSLACWNGASVSFALATDAVWHGQYWRLLTSTLVHANVVHLASSLVFAWILGAPLERRYGPWRMVLLFSLLALASSAAQFLSGWPGVGMSGVLYGYLGLILAAGYAAHGPRIRLRPLVVTIMLILFVLCLVVPAQGNVRVGNLAHGTGLAVGLALGWALRAERPFKPLALVALTSAALALATTYMPWSYWWWYHRAEVLQDREQVLLAARRAIDLAPDDRAVAPLLIYMGREAVAHEAYEQAISWFARALLVTELPAGAKVELASAYYEVFRDADARWMLSRVSPQDLTPEEQSHPFYNWYLEWAKTSETQPAGEPGAESQPAEETPPPIDERIRRLLDPARMEE